MLASVRVASAQEAPSDESTSTVGRSEDLEQLTNHVIAKELELQKLNAHFRMESTRQPRWRPWRQFVYAETNAGCTEAGLIARMALSYPFMRRPATIYMVSTVTKSSAGKVRKVVKITASLSKAPRPDAQLVERAAATQMIGQLIGATGDIFELSSNLISSLKDRKHGFDSRTYARKVERTSKKLDELLAQREETIQTIRTTAPLSSTHELELAQAEGAVLHDVRDLTLLQYAQYHSGARKLRFFQNAAYVLNITKNAAGAAGNMVNLESTHLSQPKLAGTASLLTLVAGAVIVATPVVGRVSGNLAGLVDRRIVSKNFVNVQSQEARTFADHRQVYAQLLSQAASSTDALTRARIYDGEEKLLLAQQGNLQREHRQAKSTTVENVVFAGLVGSTRITQGVLGMVGAWHYYNKPWINSRLTAAGATAYGAGSLFNILETARVRTSAEVTSHKLKTQHLLPSQVVQDRIDSLDSMENALTVLAASPHRMREANVGTSE
jgi:hypothetical protein